MFIQANPNPKNKRVGDCTIRAISLATGEKWDAVYAALCAKGFEEKDMPSANKVWGAYLKDKGYEKHGLPDTCPVCYTVADFANEHQGGTYIVSCDGHVVCVKNGNILDTWDSGDLTALYYWEEK